MYEFVELPNFDVEEIYYDKEIQREKVHPIYEFLKQSIRRGAFSHFNAKEQRHREKDARATLSGSEIYKYLFLLKDYSFRQEVETRLITYFDKKVTYAHYNFSAKGRMIKPYLDYQLTSLEIPSIVKVKLGPKNSTPVEVIEQLLDFRGFSEVDVSKSDSPYR